MVLVAGCAAFSCASAAERAAPELGAWQDYAIGAVTPDFDWADHNAAVAPSVATLAERTVAAREEAFSWSPERATVQFSVAAGSGTLADLPTLETDRAGVTHLGFNGGLERSFVSPKVSHALNEDTSISASAVFVYQQFASWNFGEGVNTIHAGSSSAYTSPVSESSSGSGVRLELNRSLAPELGLVASYQSRINMDALQTYRGVFSDPGDFDLPAIAGVGFAWQPMSNVLLGTGVSRVLWSDVTAFTSRALPRDLLRLLGDGTSPAFEWSDLTVIQLNLGWQVSPQDLLTMTISTHQQPVPTSTVLRSALERNSNETDIGLRYAHDFSPAMRLSLGASYAPAEYFLGNASFWRHDSSGNQLEVEAVWSMSF